MLTNWNDCAKRLLKAELVKRGVTHDRLVNLLTEVGVAETKAGIDSKISRGTFSAVFLLQCLNAIGCHNLSSAIQETTSPSINKKRIIKKKQSNKNDKNR